MIFHREYVKLGTGNLGIFSNFSDFFDFFSCYKCNEEFDNKEMFETHMKDRHSQNYYCRHCQVEFSGNALKSGDVKTMEEAAREAAAEGSLVKEGEVKGEQDMEARLAEAWKDTMAGKEVDLDAIWNEAIASGQDFDMFGD